VSGEAFGLLLAFEGDDPGFVRGFEVGRLWAILSETDDNYEAEVHASNAEMILRLAEATERTVHTDELGSGWLTAHFSTRTTEDEEGAATRSVENVRALPICPECAEGRHVYCLDDGSSTWTGRCRCTCRDAENPPAQPDEEGAAAGDWLLSVKREQLVLLEPCLLVAMRSGDLTTDQAEFAEGIYTRIQERLG